MKTRKRTIFTILFILIFAIGFYVSVRGEYLQTLGIGEQYLEILKQNSKQMLTIFLISFIVVYIATYITTRFIKKGLKVFFEEEKREMPKLPNKSISLTFGTIFGLAILKVIPEKIILAFNSAKFGITDPVFGIDIGYYVFQKPFIEAILLGLIFLIAILSIYILVYYIIAFNKFFDKGINMETLKKNIFLKHLITNAFIVIILISLLILVKSQNILFDKFITIGNNENLYGAGIAERTIKLWGYILFALVIPVCSILAYKNFKKKQSKKTFAYIMSIPAYLVLLFLVLVGFDLIYVNSSELDKEKINIENNISYTKNAYGIKIDEIDIENSGTITLEDASENAQIINNVNLLNEEVVLANLEEYQTSLGYYTFKDSQIGLYNDKLVYVTPREIVINDTRTYNNKTYEYTHGYGAIITSASSTDRSGYLDYIKNGFIENDDEILIKEPRIYFGIQTNEAIVINPNNKTEYDYPLTTTTNSYTSYKGKAGLDLDFFDRLIIGIKEKNLKLAFSNNTENNIIITNRNVRERAKAVMPYLLYDENPYLVITDEGKLTWVLDAYTTSSNYPYSQMTYIKLEDGTTKKINYIKNSVKVLIDAYDGTMKFYITDKNDPIIMAYWNMYPNLFQDIYNASIPEDIANHIIYSEYLYNIQADILKIYHDVQPEVLYRADDIWAFAKVNNNIASTSNGTDIKPYYSTVKTVDSTANKLGLIIPYTVQGKQNITSYLVGRYDEKTNTPYLKMYKFKANNAILGTNQLDSLIQEDETISKEINALNITGTVVEKDIIILPVNKTLLYIEPIYQVKLNEGQVPVLKKVVVASGNKLAIGNTLKEALDKLLSQEAVISIDIEGATVDELIKEIIQANTNLTNSNQSNNWEMVGKDLSKLQELINQLEELTKDEENKKIENIITDNNIRSDNKF